MNFLAHLVLAPQTPEGWVGSLAPDMTRGPLPIDLHPDVRAAAVEHQRIDRFTDRSPHFLTTRSRLLDCCEPRLAGIVTDVIYDHMLSISWPDWRADTLPDYVGHVEQALAEHTHLMPQAMRPVVARMIDQQWLLSYAEPDRLRQRLSDMSGRVSARIGRQVELTGPVDRLDVIGRGIEQDFRRFWPDLVDYVHAGRGTQSAICEAS